MVPFTHTFSNLLIYVRCTPLNFLRLFRKCNQDDRVFRRFVDTVSLFLLLVLRIGWQDDDSFVSVYIESTLSLSTIYPSPPGEREKFEWTRRMRQPQQHRNSNDFREMDGLRQLNSLPSTQNKGLNRDPHWTYIAILSLGHFFTPAVALSTRWCL